uniref:Uncharacterized protein n=1 Tax=Glossina palpalis gambiensis TaxID=67801 RepID=A0A1B0C2X4_9MUSC
MNSSTSKAENNAITDRIKYLTSSAKLQNIRTPEAVLGETMFGLEKKLLEANVTFLLIEGIPMQIVNGAIRSKQHLAPTKPAREPNLYIINTKLTDQIFPMHLYYSRTLRSFKVFNNFHLLLLKLPLPDWSVHNSVFTLFLTDFISFMMAISPISPHKLGDIIISVLDSIFVLSSVIAMLIAKSFFVSFVTALTQDLGALYSAICRSLPSSSDDKDELEENG